MFVQCDAVHGEGVAEEVEVLASVPHRVGPSEPQRVVEVPVDGLGVVATGIQPGEGGVGGWDLADVLDAVEAAPFATWEVAKTGAAAAVTS